MKKILIVLGLFLYSISSYSYVSFEHSREIFKKLTQGKIDIGFYLKDSWEVNASCYMGKIHIYKGMLYFAKNDDEMALVIAHEIAHHMLGHWTSTPPNEFAADKFGAQIAKYAGYNVCRGAQAVKRFGDPGSRTHPSSNERYKRLASSCK